MRDVPLTTQARSIAVGEGEELALARQAATNPACFAELYRRHAASVYRYLLVRVSDTRVAQDLTSQTFLAALEGIKSYEGRGTVAAWLFRIARRQLALYLRSHRRILPLDAADLMPCPDPPLDQVVEEHLKLERVAKGLRSIAPERAEALALRIFGGLSAAEVGALLGKSEAAVKMLVQRAVCDLQARLGGEEGER